jgi:glutathione-regulated potassium-efflux system ancillary protein KefF
VLARGWAYGDDSFALEGKRCLWVTTTGGDEHAFTAAGMHGHAFEAFVPVIEQTARFCRMRWEEPLVLRAAHRVSEAVLEEGAQRYRARLERLLEAP